VLRVYITVLLLPDGCAVDLLLDKCMGQIVLLTQYCSADQIEKNEKGGACSTYGGGYRCIQDFGGKTLKERDNLKDPGLDGKIILRWIFRKWNVWTGSSWLRIETGGEHL